MLAGYLGNFSRFEIERKFVLKELPASLPDNYVDITDKYLCNSSLRLRIETSPLGKIIGRKLTKKDKAPNKGPEISIMTSLYLSEDDLTALGAIEGSSINKRRYIYEDDECRIVYDEFINNLEGLLMAEIEFRDSESCSKFKPKDSSWKEVTGNPEYSGGNLAFRIGGLASNI